MHIGDKLTLLSLWSFATSHLFTIESLHVIALLVGIVSGLISMWKNLTKRKDG